MKPGAEIDVKESDGKVYKANVLKVEGSKCFIHYKGWASSWDEWLDIPEECEGSDEEVKLEEKVVEQKSNSDKRKHSSSSSVSSTCSAKEKEPPLKKLKPNSVSELEISRDVEVAISTPPNRSLDESQNNDLPNDDLVKSKSHDLSTPKHAISSSSSSLAQKTSTKKVVKPDEKQKTILSFFKKFNPAPQKSPKQTMKKAQNQMEETSDEIEILEKVSPEENGKKADEKAEKTMVSSPIGFFKLDGGGAREREKSAKFTCQHCKMTFSNMLTWKSHEDGHIQVFYNIS